jgi:hypothetical protein
MYFKEACSNSSDKKAYFLYFGCKVGYQDKSWAPHMHCTSCSSKLNIWVNRKGCSLLFAVPMMWMEPTNHLTDCYFCMVPLIEKEITRKKKWIVEYPNIPSGIRPVPDCDGLPIPDPSCKFFPRL